MPEHEGRSGLPRGLQRLRRVKPIFTDLLVEYSRGHRSKSEEPPASASDPGSAVTPRKLLRLWLRSPWEDYTLVRGVSTESSLAYRQGTYFQRATVRTFSTSRSVEVLQALSRIQHPNVANIYDVYCHDNKLFIVSEYLPLSLVDLDFHSFPFEEWEIATIIVEILKGSAYLLFKGVSCREISMSSIRVSTDGSIKLGEHDHLNLIQYTNLHRVLDIEQYEQEASDESAKLSHALLDIPYLAEIVEEMLLPRYHLDDDDESWSKHALEFFSCCLSGSIETLLNHPFLAQAKPAKKLAPRVQFAGAVSRIDALSIKEEIEEKIGPCGATRTSY